MHYLIVLLLTIISVLAIGFFINLFARAIISNFLPNLGKKLNSPKLGKGSNPFKNLSIKTLKQKNSLKKAKNHLENHEYEKFKSTIKNCWVWNIPQKPSTNMLENHRFNIKVVELLADATRFNNSSSLRSENINAVADIEKLVANRFSLLKSLFDISITQQKIVDKINKSSARKNNDDLSNDSTGHWAQLEVLNKISEIKDDLESNKSSIIKLSNLLLESIFDNKASNENIIYH